MTDTDLLKWMLNYSSAHNVMWYEKDGGVVCEINGITVILREEILGRTHSGVVLTLAGRPGIGGSVAEPIEKCPLKDDLKKLFENAKRRALPPETAWQKLCWRLMGFSREEN